MCTRPLVLGVLVGSVVLACGSRSDLIGVPGAGPADAGASPDATASQDAGSTADAKANAGGDAMVGAAASPEQNDGAAGGADGATCTLVTTSSYDRSCTVDANCVNVGQVLSCPATECAFCQTGTISTGAAAQYMADFSAATASVPRDGNGCNCPSEGRPCCRSGACEQCSR